MEKRALCEGISYVSVRTGKKQELSESIFEEGSKVEYVEILLISNRDWVEIGWVWIGVRISMTVHNILVSGYKNYTSLGVNHEVGTRSPM